MEQSGKVVRSLPPSPGTQWKKLQILMSLKGGYRVLSSEELFMLCLLTGFV